MPVTPFQDRVCRLLAINRAPDSYLADGTALHAAPNSQRFSNDVDYFDDSIARVAEAFAADRALLESHGYAVTVEVQQPGHIRARVAAGPDETRLEWAHDSSWRFLPVLADEVVGFVLHPIDLALNKVLALAGRDEPRDLLDVIDAHHRILPLGALVWAAAGKDPGFSPASLLELLKRRGTHRAEDFARLRLAQSVDLVELKREWRAALDDAEQFLGARPKDEVGCLYYAPSRSAFVMPRDGVPSDATTDVPVASGRSRRAPAEPSRHRIRRLGVPQRTHTRRITRRERVRAALGERHPRERLMLVRDRLTVDLHLAKHDLIRRANVVHDAALGAERGERESQLLAQLARHRGAIVLPSSSEFTDSLAREVCDELYSRFQELYSLGKVFRGVNVPGDGHDGGTNDTLIHFDHDLLDTINGNRSPNNMAILLGLALHEAAHTIKVNGQRKYSHPPNSTPANYPFPYNHTSPSDIASTENTCSKP